MQLVSTAAALRSSSPTLPPPRCEASHTMYLPSNHYRVSVNN